MGWKNDFEVFFVDSTGRVLLGEATYICKLVLC